VPPARRADVVSRTVDDEVIILDRSTGYVHRLNTTASCIWNYCNGHNSPETIAACLAKDFDRSPDSVINDVTETIRNLTDLGLLVDDSLPPT
jgi:hypothetical protein